MRQMGSKPSIGMILGLLAVVALAVFAFRGCNPTAGIPGTGGAVNQQEGQLGRAFVTDQVSQNGCPQGTTDQFSSTDTIYVGFTESDIPQGTSLFARLLREGEPIEDTDEITADSDLRTCIWFEFQPSGGFEPGDYSAQLFVNGNPADEVEFSVGSAQGGLFGGTTNGTANGAELGRLFSSTQVDSNGCPLNSVDDFRPDESVYIAYERSFIPAGSQMFARLLREGQNVEDTDVITAERDINACVWFVFEAEQGTGGLEPGFYEAQIYLNGDPVDQVEFEVR